MSMILYGSYPSPYVRRIRMLLENMDYRFEAVDVYSDAGRQAYTSVTPIKKLPVLVDDGATVFDSHVICEYLRRKQNMPETSIDQLNLVSAIDSVNDSLVLLFMAGKSGLDVNEDTLIFKLQRERIPDSLNWLNTQAEQGGFSEWHIGTIALIALLDWAEFRELYDFSAYPALVNARAAYQARTVVTETYPQ
ncbi:MAG: glutathione S-transferase family protein [Pontibacterium sp.]